MIKKITELIPFKSDLEKLLFHREFESLREKSSVGILGFALILLITFSALGFSVGSIDYLEKRMDNPLTDWLNVTIPDKSRDDAEAIIDTFAINSRKADFGLEEIMPFRNFSAELVNSKGNAPFCFGRSISATANPDLIDIIISGQNLIHLNIPDYKTEYENGGAVVVTEKLLERLGINLITSQKRIQAQIGESRIFLKIIAVVREIPSGYEGAEFLCSPKFQNYYEGASSIDLGRGVFNFISDFHDTQKITQTIDPNNEYEITLDESSEFIISDDIQHRKYKVRGTNKIYDRIGFVKKLSNSFPDNEFYPYYSFTTEDEDDEIIDNPENLTFIFSNWKNIREFKTFVDNNFPNLRIDMTDVKEKENFNLVSSLTTLLATFLFFFGILAVGALFYGILKNHLESNSSNLGTLKAFGLKSKKLNTLYLKVIAYFIGLSLFPAILIGIILHFLLPVMLQSTFGNETIFNFFNIFILLAIIFFVMLCYFILYLINTGILKKTPGDLIFGR